MPVSGAPFSSYEVVSGKDRAKFFRRPLIPDERDYHPLPYIRYARDVVVEEQRQQQRMQQNQHQQPAAASDSIVLGRNEDETTTATTKSGRASSSSSPTKKPICGGGGSLSSATTQTLYRESESQTDPCSLPPKCPMTIREVPSDGEANELMALDVLKFGNGLPVRLKEELDVVHGLLDQERLLRKERELAFGGGGRPKKKSGNAKESDYDVHMRVIRKVLENRCKIEWSLREHFSSQVKARRREGMRSALDAFSTESEMIADEKVDRLARKQEMDAEERMRKIQKIHRKELRALELKHEARSKRLLGSKIDLKSRRDGRRASEASKRPSKASSSSSSLVKEQQQLPPGEGGDEKQFFFGLELEDAEAEEVSGGPPSSKTTTMRDARDFESRMLELAAMEKSLTKQLEEKISASNMTLSESKEATTTTTISYLPRRKQFPHLLDTVYSEIQSAKKHRSVSVASSDKRLPAALEGFRRPRRRLRRQRRKTAEEEHHQHHQVTSTTISEEEGTNLRTDDELLWREEEEEEEETHGLGLTSEEIGDEEWRSSQRRGGRRERSQQQQKRQRRRRRRPASCGHSRGSSSLVSGSGNDSDIVASAIVEQVLQSTLAEQAISQILRDEERSLMLQLAEAASAREGATSEDDESLLVKFCPGDNKEWDPDKSDDVERQRVPKRDLDKYLDRMVVRSMAAAIKEVVESDLH